MASTTSCRSSRRWPAMPTPIPPCASRPPPTTRRARGGRGGRPAEPPLAGNAYADTSVRVPHTLHDALDLWEKSELAREAFGAEVVEHYANYARVELTAYEAAVTDWELRRGFER